MHANNIGGFHILAWIVGDCILKYDGICGLLQSKTRHGHEGDHTRAALNKVLVIEC